MVDKEYHKSFFFLSFFSLQSPCMPLLSLNLVQVVCQTEARVDDIGKGGAGKPVLCLLQFLANIQRQEPQRKNCVSNYIAQGSM